MSQKIFSNIDPTVTTGLMLTGLLDDFKDAVVSGFSGDFRPERIQAGGLWVDTSLAASPNYLWTLKLYTGSTDITLFNISVLTGASGATLAKDTFTISHVAADTAGAILSLVKNRTSGGVLNGDTIGELRITGRTNTPTDPVVAYLRATASEDYTNSAQGTTFSLVSTPTGTSQLYEHLRMLSNLVETTLPHKVNSLVQVPDAVATAASITLTPDKLISELTGATAGNIHGCTVDVKKSKVKYVHNRSTAEVTIKHDSSVVTAAQRFSLPNSADMVLLPQGSVAFYYCETDTRWKYLLGFPAGVRGFVTRLPDGYTEWVASHTGQIRVLAFQEPSQEPSGSGAQSGFARSSFLKTIQAWGANGNSQLGVGDTTDRSSPTAVAGNPFLKLVDIGGQAACAQDDSGKIYSWGFNQHGQLDQGVAGLDTTIPQQIGSTGLLSFTRAEIDESAFAQTYSGALYAWGRNQFGQLGLGDVTPRSSPVAVLGGLKFASVFHGAEGEGSVFGVERETGALYAWGKNDHGQLGDGTVVAKSSPVAVLGGLKFRKVAVGSGAVVGLSESGVPYAWGLNVNGELGDGTVVAKSSPVAVLGGLILSDVFVIPGTNNSFFGITNDGVLYAWGQNANGELGDGTVVAKSSPVAVLGGLKWERIARLNSTTRSIIAIQMGSGSAYGWGKNDHGQLGQGDVIPKSSPVAVAGGLKFSRIQIGANFAYGAASDGRHYAWGQNTVGQLGDGTTVDKSSPVVVQGLTEPFFEVPTLSTFTVVKGTTYKIKAGGGASFFNDVPIGKNIRRITIGYDY